MKAFTLVELLIVVAIIGILSIVGIPTYKRMVQKAKKIESKTGLGAIFTIESVFFSEYGAYGTNLQKMGLEFQGEHYSIGMPEWPGIFCRDNFDLTPNAPEEIERVNAGIGGYYNLSTYRSVYLSKYATNTSQCYPGFTLQAGTSAVLTYFNLNGPAFLATASGPIAHGLDRTSYSLTDADVWMMTSNRYLLNSQDGVR